MRRNREKEFQNSRNLGAPRAQNLRALGQFRLRKPQNVVAMISSPSRKCVDMQKRPSDAPRSRKSSRKTRAKQLQNSRNFGAPRAEKLPKLGQHALCEPKNIVAGLKRIGNAFKCEESARLASMSSKFCAKLARRIFKEIRRAARAKIACTRPASATHAQNHP